MKTILINVFDNAVAKNIFMPEFNAAVANARNTRCVVVVPQAKLEEYRHDYAGLGLEFVARPQKFASGFETLALFLARNSIPTHSVRQIQETGLDGSGRLPFPRYLVARTFWLLGHVYVFRSLLKTVLPLFFDANIFDMLLEEHKPDLVFATTVYAVDDIRLLRAAKRRGVPTLGMIKSWDNLTSKDMLLVPPDWLIVHNEVVKEEVLRLHHYPAERTAVVGVPQFDWYADPSFPVSREAFFRGLRLDPAKKLITYTAMGLWLVPHERDIIALLARIIDESKLAVPAQLLVRMHPAYPDEKLTLQKLFPRAVIDEPGSPVLTSDDVVKADWKFSIDDVRHLASTLKHSDVTLNGGSTMILDAACFDTPIIGIAFDGGVEEPSYWRSARCLFEREHCKKVAETRGVRVVHTEQELIKALDLYLSNPHEDRVYRAAIVKQQTGTLGHASGRVAEVMLKSVLRK